ncbi:MAG: DUF1820 family protein [Gammaproteobacteria bacterium]
MAKKRVFRVFFMNQGKVYELYAKDVSQGALYGFVEVRDLIFGERSDLLVDPAEEKLKTEFGGVSRLHIPMHAVLRIDEVEQQGVSKVVDAPGGNVTPFPVYTPGGGPEGR